VKSSEVMTTLHCNHSISTLRAKLSGAVYHSVARQCYTVVRAMQQVNGKLKLKWEIAILGCQNSVTLNRSTKNLTHMITSVRWPRTLNFIKIGGTRASRQYGEMYTSRTF